MASSAFVAVLVVDLHFPEAGSLKAKRKELSSVKSLLHSRHGAAVSEVGHQDRWQRATLAVALSSGTLSQLEVHADAIERWLEGRFPQGVRVERLVASLEDLRG